MHPERRLAPGTDIAAWLATLPLDQRRAAVALLGPEDGDALDRDWPSWAHRGQLAPPAAPDGADWATWVITAGRGFGKTLAGSHWVTGLVAQGAPLSVALVGATLEDARQVMVEGRSGLLAVAGAWVTDWNPSLRRLKFRTGAQATLFSGASPEMLRGPEHHYAWCDELAKWEKPRETWDVLQLGLRLPPHPRALITTTPRSGPVLGAIMAEAGTVTTGGPTRANPHLPAAWKRRVEGLYAGTRLGEQELEGKMLPGAAGALWTVELIERSRRAQGSDWAPIATQRVESANAGQPAPPGGDRSDVTDLLRDGRAGPAFTRTLIAVDPPAVDGTCGIIAVARAGAGADAIAHILADHSVTARTPEGWSGAVASAAAAHGTRDVLAECNQGGKMVKAVLLNADPGLRIRLVSATRGKSLRAEPVAHLFEAGKVRLHGRMPELEAELLGMIAGGGYDGPGKSPDRADAMVWGVGEVMRNVGTRVRGV